MSRPRTGPPRRQVDAAITFVESHDKCMHCGQTECVCARWPGFKLKRWVGPERRFNLAPDRLLRLAMAESLAPGAPVDFFIATIRYFAETDRDYVECA